MLNRRDTKSRLTELEASLGEVLFAENSPANVDGVLKRIWEGQRQLNNRLRTTQSILERLETVLPEVEKRQNAHRNATKQLERVEVDIATLQQELGQAAFQGLLAGNIVPSPLFEERSALQERLAELQSQKAAIDESTKGDWKDHLKSKSHYMKVTVQIKVEALKVGGLHKKIGRTLLADGIEATMRCSETSEVLDRVCMKRTEQQDAADLETAARIDFSDILQTAAAIVQASSFESVASVQVEVKRLKRQLNEIGKLLAKNRSAMLEAAANDETLMKKAAVGAQLTELAGLKARLEETKPGLSDITKIASVGWEQISRRRKSVAGVAITLLLVGIVWVWANQRDGGKLEIAASKTTSPEETNSPAEGSPPTRRSSLSPSVPQDEMGADVPGSFPPASSLDDPVEPLSDQATEDSELTPDDPGPDPAIEAERITAAQRQAERVAAAKREAEKVAAADEVDGGPKDTSTPEKLLAAYFDARSIDERLLYVANREANEADVRKATKEKDWNNPTTYSLISVQAGLGNQTKVVYSLHFPVVWEVILKKEKGHFRFDNSTEKINPEIKIAGLKKFPRVDADRFLNSPSDYSDRIVRIDGIKVISSVRDTQSLTSLTVAAKNNRQRPMKTTVHLDPTRFPKLEKGAVASFIATVKIFSGQEFISLLEMIEGTYESAPAKYVKAQSTLKVIGTKTIDARRLYVKKHMNGNAVVGFQLSNTSDLLLSHVNMDIKCFDTNDRVLGTDDATVQNIRPGNKAVLEFILDDIKVEEIAHWDLGIRDVRIDDGDGKEVSATSRYKINPVGITKKGNPHEIRLERRLSGRWKTKEGGEFIFSPSAHECKATTKDSVPQIFRAEVMARWYYSPEGESDKRGVDVRLHHVETGIGMQWRLVFVTKNNIAGLITSIGRDGVWKEVDTTSGEKALSQWTRQENQDDLDQLKRRLAGHWNAKSGDFYFSSTGDKCSIVTPNGVTEVFQTELLSRQQLKNDFDVLLVRFHKNDSRDGLEMSFLFGQKGKEGNYLGFAGKFTGLKVAGKWKTINEEDQNKSIELFTFVDKKTEPK